MKEPTIRRLQLPGDQEFVLALHAQINFQSDSEWFRGADESRYVQRWLQTPQVTSFLQQLELSSADPRALMEIWELDGEPVGYLWVTFTDVEGYRLCIAEIQDMGLVARARRQGLGRKMLAYVETEAHSRGADILRASTGAGNQAARALYESASFEPVSLEYEKLLDDTTRSQDHQAPEA